jgi:hypothetical protein
LITAAIVFVGAGEEIIHEQYRYENSSVPYMYVPVLTYHPPEQQQQELKIRNDHDNDDDETRGGALDIGG